MTEKQFKNQIARVLSAENALNKELQKLGMIVSEVLGAEYIADICNGAEIEFRPVGKDGVADDGIGPDTHTTIMEEDVINRLRKH